MPPVAGAPRRAPIRAVIVDDEWLARAELRRLLGEVPGVEVVGESDAVADAVEMMERARPELLFLDVQLRGETGFALLDALAPRPALPPFAVVFVTAFDRHALRAFEVNALDYLLKPVDPARLAGAVARARRVIGGEPPRDEPEGAGAARPSPRPLAYDDRLFVEIARRPQFVGVRDIVCIAAQDDYTQLLLRDGRHPLVATPLQQWEERLPAEHFVRVHRSAIVQYAAVTRIEPWSNGTFRLFVAGYGRPVPMSRRYASRLRERLR